MSDPGVKTDLYVLVYGIIRQALQDAQSNPTKTGKFCTSRWKDDAIDYLTTDRVYEHINWLKTSEVDIRLIEKIEMTVDIFRGSLRR